MSRIMCNRSEQFSVAGRSVNTGLVGIILCFTADYCSCRCSIILDVGGDVVAILGGRISLWRQWAILYIYIMSVPTDMSGYASGATIQILLFAILAIELKRRAPTAHTFLEAVRARYGKVAHLVYFVFGMMTNILVTAMLLSGLLS